MDGKRTPNAKDAREGRIGQSPSDEATEAHRSAFARALARSLFGRNYWDDAKERSLQEARKRPRTKSYQRSF